MPERPPSEDHGQLVLLAVCQEVFLPFGPAIGLRRGVDSRGRVGIIRVLQPKEKMFCTGGNVYQDGGEEVAPNVAYAEAAGATHGASTEVDPVAIDLLIFHGPFNGL